MKSLRHVKINNLSDFEDALNRLEMTMQPAYFNRLALEEIQRRCLDLGEKKSHDYGANGDAIAMTGPRGVVTRMLDKQMRLLSLTAEGFSAHVMDESLIDTAMDMINYATYLVALLEGTWGVAPLNKNDPGVMAIKTCEAAAKYLMSNNEIESKSDIAMALRAAAESDYPF